MAKERAKRLYAVYRQRDGRYHHAEIDLILPSPYGSDEDRSVSVRLTWQSDPSHPYWYACGIEVKAESLEALERAAAQLRRIWRGKEIGWHYQPQQAIADLEAAGWSQAAYDARYHRYVPLQHWLDSEVSLWGDDYRAVGAEQGMASTLARSSEEAKDAIARSLAERAGSGDARCAEYLARWLQAGRPVHILEEGRPAPKPALEVLQLEWAPPAEAQELEVEAVQA